jgi:phosphoglycolate phosphatase-like HAD superfamily hydrolase
MAQRPLKYQAVIIFDWDDTLICTSFLSKRADLPRTAAFDRQMKKVEESAVKILRQATQAGRVLIITNAVDGWVEYSAKEYMPEILPVLRRVEVVSARHRYGSQFPDEAAQWKVHTFLDAQKRLPQILTNLIAVGDSDFEMDAARIMGHRFAEGLTKTVKLRENPAPEELVKDLEFLSRNFTSVVDSVKNLQLNVLRKSAWKY